MTDRTAPQPDSEGWIEWTSSELPVPGDTLVRVRFRNGVTSHYDSKAHSWLWGDVDGDWDILAYYPVSPAQEVEPTKVERHMDEIDAAAALNGAFDAAAMAAWGDPTAGIERFGLRSEQGDPVPGGAIILWRGGKVAFAGIVVRDDANFSVAIFQPAQEVEPSAPVAPLTIAPEIVSDMDEEIFQLRRQVTALEAENAALRTGLVPFAEAAECLDDEDDDARSVWEHPAILDLVAGDLRRARALLQGQEPAIMADAKPEPVP